MGNVSAWPRTSWQKNGATVRSTGVILKGVNDSGLYIVVVVPGEPGGFGS